MFLGLRRRRKKLLPKPVVPHGLDDVCTVIDGRPYTFNDLAARKRAQMGDHDRVSPQERLRYQQFKDPNYTEKK